MAEMDMREKLALVVCEATQKTNYKCEFNCENKGKCAHCLVMAEQMIANGVTVQGWISVKDRMPERYEYVLLWDSMDRDIFIGVLDDKREWYVPGYQDEIFRITHWMPLPQPPKGE